MCVVGAGYVGLPTAACLAHLGHDVICADLDEAKITKLQQGHVEVLEGGLPELVSAGLASGRLEFVVGASEAVTAAEFVVLCVATPEGPNGGADLSAVEAVTREIAPLLRADAVVVTKSTMPVGSAAGVARILQASGAPSTVAVASNPEFLREGTAVQEFLGPHRIVIGADDETVAGRVATLYEGVNAPVVTTSLSSAEMIKYAANAFLATKISFVNELANACEALGADIEEVIRGLELDARIGFGGLAPGPGWGGSCFPKDTAALLHATSAAGYAFELLRTTVAVNTRQRTRVVDKIRDACGGSLDSVKVALWGLTFKANTDDTRFSPAVDIARLLVQEGAVVRAFDPAAGGAAQQELGDLVEIAADAIDAAREADVLVVVTEWDEFRNVDLARVASVMATPRVIDARNVIDLKSAREAGFEYHGIGRL